MRGRWMGRRERGSERRKEKERAWKKKEREGRV